MAALAIVVPLAYDWTVQHVFVLDFDSATWRAASVDGRERIRMVESLIEGGRLIGRSRAEIVEMLSLPKEATGTHSCHGDECNRVRWKDQRWTGGSDARTTEMFEYYLGPVAMDGFYILVLFDYQGLAHDVAFSRH